MLLYKNAFLVSLSNVLDTLLMENNYLTPIHNFKQLQYIGRHDVGCLWLQKLFINTWQILKDVFLDIFILEKSITTTFCSKLVKRKIHTHSAIFIQTNELLP